MDRGIFLAFEGIDASGKSTQARRVAEQRGAHFTFEPGDSALGAQLRTWLLDATTPMSAQTEALLMLADRSHHVATVIEPRLRAGTHVVSDRYVASTLAYQGYGRGVDVDALRRASYLATGECRATLTILIDVPVDVAHERRARDADDRFESSGDEFHTRVRNGYLELAASSDEQWLVVDGTLSEPEVAAIIDQHLDRWSW